jgi:uncharacterized protein (DUF924 family)
MPDAVRVVLPRGGVARGRGGPAGGGDGVTGGRSAILAATVVAARAGAAVHQPCEATMNHRSVLSFWFEEIEPARWWQKSPEFDRLVATRFGTLHEAAARCELSAWRTTPEGRLAEIVLLDQFSRNIHRDRPEAFACDPLALALAQHAVALQADAALVPAWRAFLDMPYMHSESPAIHAEALRLFDQPGLERALEFERRHKAVIDRFGRYPHRNAILGRASTAEEIAFLATPGASF